MSGVVPCPATAKTWVDHAIAITPLIIAAVVAVVAFLQYRLAREKLRLDLYNRRYEIYRSIFDFYHVLIGWKGTEADKAQQAKFFQAYQESKFLFSEKSGISAIYKKLNDGASKVIGFKENSSEYAKEPELFMKLFNETNAIQINEFDEGLRALEAKMKPYLTFRRA